MYGRIAAPLPPLCLGRLKPFSFQALLKANFVSSSSHWQQPHSLTELKQRFDLAHGLPTLCVNQATTYQWSLAEDLENYSAAGVGGMGVWMQKVTAEDEDEAIASLIDSGMNFSSVSWITGLTGTMGSRLDDVFEEAFSTIRLGAILNADCVLVTTGRRGNHIRTHQRRVLIDSLKRLGDMAADLDIPVALHPMCDRHSYDYSFMTSLQQAVDILDEVDHRFVKLAFSSFDNWQEENLSKLISEISQFVAIVQLSDWDKPKSAFDRRCLGDGVIPLRQIVQDFLKAGFDGPFELDVWSEELWKSKIEYFQVLQQQIKLFTELSNKNVRAPFHI